MLRTKIQIGLIILFLMSILVASVALVGQSIPDSPDDSGIFVRNTKGNYWECTGANVQTAIWDLNDTDGGTVYVDGDVTLTSELRFGGSDGAVTDVIVDFQNNKVTLDGDISFVNMTATRSCTVKNVKVLPTAKHTNSIIELYLGPKASWSDRVRYNTFENIRIANTGSWKAGSGYVDHNFTGIHLEIHTGNMLMNTFRDIRMSGVKTGILLENQATSGWGNGNYFDNIWIDQFVTAIWFDVHPSASWGFNHNVFFNVKAQTADYSVDGVKDISHNGNHFDHCLIWDWYAAENPNHEWSVSSDASYTYINAHLITDILDQGAGTTIAMGAVFNLKYVILGVVIFGLIVSVIIVIIINLIVSRVTITKGQYKYSMRNFREALLHRQNLNKPTPYAKKLYYALKERGLECELKAYDGYEHVDISIEQAKFNIGIDGKHHSINPNQLNNDLKRAYYPSKKGYDTIRFTNEEIDEDIGKIADTIAEVAEQRQKRFEGVG